MFGTGSNNARAVRRGDGLYVWWASRGWLAKCVVTSDAQAPSISNPAPWNDGRNYRYMFGIEVIDELDPPHNPGSSPIEPGSNDRRQNISGIPNPQLSQFPRLKSEQAAGVDSFFSGDDGLIDLVLEELAEVEAFEGVLERTARQVVRGEQAAVRRLLLGGGGRGVCFFCQREMSADFLVGAHIKRRSACSDLEKRDLANVAMLNCRFGCDELYERGLIGVDEHGTVLRSPDLSDLVAASYATAHIVDSVGVPPESEGYFAWHLSHTFRRSSVEPT